MIRLLLLLTLVPVLELVVLLQVHHMLAVRWGSGVGLLVTLGSIVLTGIAGATLARYQGLAVLRSIQESMLRAELPGPALVDGVLVLIGGALLLTPGYLTDVLGFSFLIPGSRALHRKFLLRWIKNKIQRGEIHVEVNTTHFQEGFSERAIDSDEKKTHDRPLQ